MDSVCLRRTFLSFSFRSEICFGGFVYFYFIFVCGATVTSVTNESLLTYDKLSLDMDLAAVTVLVTLAGTFCLHSQVICTFCLELVGRIKYLAEFVHIQLALLHPFNFLSSMPKKGHNISFRHFFLLIFFFFRREDNCVIE